METIWDRNPSKGEVISYFGSDEKNQGELTKSYAKFFINTTNLLN